MKTCWILMYLTSTIAVPAQQAPPSPVLPEARIMRVTLDSNSVTLLRLRPGYVSSVHVPDEVSSVVLGDPGSFKAEHSEAEPRLVFIKPTSSIPGETNALITTKSGREISLHLINTGATGQTAVDFVLEYRTPRGFLIEDSQPGFVVAETRSLIDRTLPQRTATYDLQRRLEELLHEPPIKSQRWRGKKMRVALGPISDEQQEMIVVFSVINASSKTIELLPPQVQLAGVSASKHGKSIIADQVPVKEYKMTTRRLPPHGRADVAVAFERPSFKQASEQMLLQVAQAEEVDRPVFLPIPFVATLEGEMK